MSPLLSTADIEARIAGLTEPGTEPDTVPPTPLGGTVYKFIRPLSEAADNLIDVFQNTEGRWLFGLREIDLMVRGVGRGELCYVTGFAHSGKTQVVLGSIIHAPSRPVVLFTFDETAELVLTKLVCMQLGWNAEVLEERIKAGDNVALDAVRRVASQDFPNLLIVDAPLSFGGMTEALNEATEYFGRDIAAVIVDYLELVPSNDIDVGKKSQSMKQWTKQVDLPVICLHQGSRGHAGKGQSLSMQSMRYGGEAEANFVLGVRRRRDDDTLEPWEVAEHENTVSVSVLKNKRPPSRKGEVTYHMEPSTGVISSIQPDLPHVPMSPSAPMSLREQAEAARSR